MTTGGREFQILGCSWVGVVKTGEAEDVGETVLSRIPGSVVLFEGVADGQAVTSDAWRTEVQVVVDQVKSAFGTNEEAAVTGIQLKASAEIHQEVFVALVIGVVSVPATLTVDAGVLGADAADEFQIGVASELRRVNGIDVEKMGRNGRVGSPPYFPWPPFQ